MPYLRDFGLKFDVNTLEFTKTQSFVKNKKIVSLLPKIP